ncbi:paralemmin-2-like [Hippocampus comes]|uniref:paralemmin-2-like n=1 Tax=Hippocampus comes TaxID=109280 RepID=UPI00094E2EF7|nr:PREDICTED: paralemmin-2-like [Hippocampus comes]
MAQRQFQESGKDGRSVLGMLTVQVERDPKTGATVVKSVAPTSTPDSRPPASAVFDDGRKSIHAVGGSGCNPSTEELGQILSAVDGVGMQVMLDEVTVTLDEAADAGASGGPFKQIQAPVNQSAAKENRMRLESPGRPNSEDKMTREVSRLSVRGEEDANATVVRDTAGKEVTMEDHVLEESPITLLFLGYADSTTAQENPDMLVAERVMIADDGEEPRVADREAGEKSESEMDQGIPQKGKDQTSQVREDHANQEPSCPPTVEERKGPSKHKTCHCCSVM